MHYAGLESSPWHAAQLKYSPRGAGAVLAFELEGGTEAGQAFVSALELHSNVANIGDVRSLVIHPASTTHSQLTPEEQALSGVTPGLVRLAVGIEHIDDILADLDAGLPRREGCLTAHEHDAADAARVGTAPTARRLRRTRPDARRVPRPPAHASASRAPRAAPTGRRSPRAPPGATGDPVGRRQFADLGPLKLESGGRLPAVRLAYETWGELNEDGTNAVLVLHALTGDSHVTGEAGDGHPTPGWWSSMVGPGRADRHRPLVRRRTQRARRLPGLHRTGVDRGPTAGRGAAGSRC